MCRKLKITFLLAFIYTLTNINTVHGQDDCCLSSGIISSPLDDYGWTSTIIDGDTYIVGWSISADATYPMITRVDAIGNIVWQYTSDSQGQIYDLVESNSDGIFFVGRTAPLQEGPLWQDNKIIIGHIQKNGTVDFVNTFDNEGRETILSMMKHPNPPNPAAPYYFISFHNPEISSPSAVDDAVLNNMDENGNIVWSKEFQYDSDDQWGWSIIPYTVDGSILVSGSSFPTNRGIIIKYDGATGEPIKGIHASTTVTENIYFDLAEGDDGTIIAIGHERLANGTTDGIVCAFTGDLDFIEGIRYENIEPNSFNSLNFSPVTNSLITGYRTADGTSLFIKIDAVTGIFSTGAFGGEIEDLRPFTFGPRIGGDNNRFTALGSFETQSAGLDLQYGNYDIDLKISCTLDSLPVFKRFSDYPHEEFTFESQDYMSPEPQNDFILTNGNLTIRSACSGEVCGNGLDDDGDGFIDCDDPDLQSDCCCIGPEDESIEAILCPLVPVEINGESYDFPGVYTQSIVSAEGCESTLTITVVDGDVIEFIESYALCPNDTIIVNGIPYTTPGIFVQEIPSAMGCDSILTIEIDNIDSVTGTTSASFCPGGSVVVNGETFNSVGTFSQTLTSASGCDSLLTVLITEDSAVQVNEAYTLCEGEQLEINGEIYSTTGNFTQNIPSTTGCDTLLQLDIEVLPVMNTTESYSICPGGSVVVNGETYDMEGTFVQMINNNTACPSTLTIIIDQEDNPAITETHVICNGGSVIVYGEEYNAAGTYVQMVDLGNGCLTEVTAIVTVDSSMDVTENYSICPGEVIVVNNQAYNAAGTYEVIIDDGNGCSYTLTIVITEMPGGSSTQNFEICPGELIVVGNQAYNAAGTYLQNIPTNTGCDSIVTILISELPAIEATENYTLCAGELLVVNNQAYNQGGTFQTLIPSTTGCDTLLTFTIELLVGQTRVETHYIIPGEIIVVGNQAYNAPGQYTQINPVPNGCDETVIVNIYELIVGATYDMEDCDALLETGNNDYTEIVANQGATSCGTLVASNLYRDNPNENIHSCTEGFGGGVAICVSSLDDCSYDRNAEEKVKIDMMLSPEAGSAFHCVGIRFDQNAPPTFDWIMGADGENNYPTLYGIRVLLNGSEVFFQDGLNTTQTWSAVEHLFNPQNPIIVNTSSQITIEMMAYCLIGNGSTVSAWDLDNVEILVACSPDPSGSRLLAGKISKTTGETVNNVNLALSSYEEHLRDLKIDDEGRYMYKGATLGKSYELTPTKVDGVTEGVTTLDILKIQKHILGVEKMVDAAQLRAGDVNNDHNISALDMIQIRKVILGLTDVFPLKDSWEFLDRKYPLTKADVYIIPTRIELKELSGDKMHNNFRAIKTGDVTGTTNGAIIARSENAEELIHLHSMIEETEDGTFVRVFADVELNLAGFQIGLALDKGEIMNISSTQMGLMDAHYSIDGRKAKISWNGQESFLTSSKEALFSVQINQSTDLSISSEVMKSEMYLGEELKVASIELNGSDLNELKESNSLKVFPNPSNETFTIQATSQTTGLGEIVIHDLSGQLIYSKYVDLENGAWSQNYASEQLGMTAGVYIIELKTSEETQTIKLVIK